MSGLSNPVGDPVVVMHTFVRRLPWRSRIIAAWRVLRTGRLP